MPNYTHDSERWLRSNAALYQRRGNQQMARNFELCAEDVKALRDEIAALKAKYNALEARIKQINVWAECDKCECLFIPGGKGSETTCGTCIKEEYTALRDVARLEEAGSDILRKIPNTKNTIAE